MTLILKQTNWNHFSNDKLLMYNMKNISVIIDDTDKSEGGDFEIKVMVYILLLQYRMR